MDLRPRESKSDPLLVEKWDLSERNIDYAVLVIRTCRELAGTDIGRVVSRQFVRSGTAVGANYHEAQGAQSRADFISKVSIAYQEALETLYWLRVIEREESLRCPLNPKLKKETGELLTIFSTILLTAKRKS